MKFLFVGSALLCIIATLHAAPAEHKQGTSFKGHKVLAATPLTAKHIDLIQKSVAHFGEGVTLWSDHVMEGRPVLLQVSPDRLQTLQRYLQHHGISFRVTIDDVEAAIHHQVAHRPSTLDVKNDFNFSIYHTNEEISAWLDVISSQHSDISRVFQVATSFHGKPIRAVHISTDFNANRQAIWIDGGIHAREWVAPATMVYFLNYFLTNYGSDTDVTDILKEYDIYILPVFNVDGYEYSWTFDENIANRMWRKTRRPTESNPLCIGADPNRNWDFEWNTVGVSPNPCSDQFPGDFAFSEPEVKEVSDFVANNNIVAYLAYHSYSQFFMLPNGYTFDQAEDYPHLQRICQAGNFRVYDVHGKEYICGSLANLVGLNSGSSADYTYGVLGIKYSFGVELRDTGEFGFLLPEDQIIPTAEEQIPFFIYLAQNMIN